MYTIDGMLQQCPLRTGITKLALDDDGAYDSEVGIGLLKRAGARALLYRLFWGCVTVGTRF